MELDLKEIWPEWKITESLSKGAYGRVYKAVRATDQDVAAIKVISIPQDEQEIEDRRIDQSEETIKKYYDHRAKEVLSEIEIMKTLRGANNIVDILDYKKVDKPGGVGCDIYIRMELLQPMKKHLSKLESFADPNRPFPTEKEIVKIGSDICEALKICHNVTENKKQIIHRDIKPDNILYHANGECYKLGDFGISKEVAEENGDHTRQIGTANYIAPEVMHSEDYDYRVDIYSLGLVLYYLANDKRLPFVENSEAYGQETMAQQRRCSGEPLPAPKNASERLAKVILKACAYRPDERYASAEELKMALEDVLRPAVSTATSVAPQPERPKPAPAKPEATEPPPDVEVGSFGPKKKKRKGKGLLVLLVALALGVFIFVKCAPKNWLKKDTDSKETKPSSGAIHEDAPNGDESSPSGDETPPEQTEPTVSTPQDPSLDAGASREQALEVALNTNHEKSIAVDGEVDWFRFTTTENQAIYRIHVNRALDENSLWGTVIFALYDSDGIKVKEAYLGTDAQDQHFDLYLPPNTTYAIKVYAESTVEVTGDYLLCITEKPIDAGYSKETAVPFVIGQRIMATMDSTVPDWYVYTFQEEGSYRVELHNIDVGSRINVSGSVGHLSHFSISAKNEDSGKTNFHVDAGDQMYIIVKLANAYDALKAEGKYILIITEEEG